MIEAPPLRQHLIEDLQLHGLAAETKRNNVRVVRQLAEHYHPSGWVSIIPWARSRCAARTSPAGYHYFLNLGRNSEARQNAVQGIHELQRRKNLPFDILLGVAL